MRRASILLIASLALAGAALSGGSSAAVTRDVARARLLLVDDDPVMFRGTGFKAAERVQLAIDAGDESARRTARSSAAGTFTMRVPGIDANDCEGFSATATGNLGSRASFKRPPGQCPILEGSGR